MRTRDAGRRLDLFLAESLDLSRAQARRLLARGVVRVNGRSVAVEAKGTPVVAGAQIAIASFTRPERQRPRAQPELLLDVLAEGPGWLAVDKPAGTPVHPLDEQETGTVLNALLARHPEAWGVGEGALRSGVVHRLDVETSGVLLMATREEVWQRLREAFRSHRVEKVYRAIVSGRVEDVGRLTLPLVTARHRPARVRVLGLEEGRRARGARDAILSWRVLERFAHAALVEVRPVTGFLHQIRAIFAHLGAPLIGDRTYGSARDVRGAARHMLHASQIATEEIRAESADPADFSALLDQLRGAR
ncbi:MAG: RluA family pseudouridine synthase [Myxococcales bacterium]|nr:RluA family pseudouridine synthase [Myxococcales bacterium]MDH5305791.1 RluA family pseudouridine synthase [Myxococcales bacterium]MDH5565788.1 RluA family pseudouridine synthase [Myxococcales bacterium]